MISEFRLQTIGGVVMTLLGFVAWVMAGTMAKFSGYLTDPSDSLAPIVRQLGLLVLAIPLVWAIFTIKKERDPSSRWTTRHSFVSGIGVAYGMFYLLGKSMSYGRLDPWF